MHVAGEADLNLYAYVHGSILIAVDPDGLEEVIRQLTKARAVEIAREAGVTKAYAKGSLAEERKVGRWVQQSALKTIDVKENAHLLFEKSDSGPKCDVLGGEAHACNAAVDTPRVRNDHGSVRQRNGAQERMLRMLGPTLGQRNTRRRNPSHGANLARE